MKKIDLNKIKTKLEISDEMRENLQREAEYMQKIIIIEGNRKELFNNVVDKIEEFTYTNKREPDVVIVSIEDWYDIKRHLLQYYQFDLTQNPYTAFKIYNTEIYPSFAIENGNIKIC